MLKSIGIHTRGQRPVKGPQNGLNQHQNPKRPKICLEFSGVSFPVANPPPSPRLWSPMLKCTTFVKSDQINIVLYFGNLNSLALFFKYWVSGDPLFYQ